ncbi:MAG: hypothetical protein ABIH40_01900 [Candidatus Omnitrophota bacterium]
MGFFLKRSITLAELLIAIALLGLLIIAIFSLDNYARFHLITSDRRARLQNEAFLCVEQMVKDAIRGIGYVGDPAVLSVPSVYCTSTELRIRVDNGNGQIDSTSAAGGDFMVRFNRNGNDLEYYPDYIRNSTQFEVLTRKVVNPAGVDIFNCSGGLIRIELMLRHRPAASSSLENPQFQMISRLYSRSESVQ